MLQRFTANGSFIPQDAAGNDMCILFMKYGRCRFKAKCKKSHWVPPPPDDPYPIEIKPPLPDDALVDTRVTTTSNSKDSPYNTPNNLLESTSSYRQATRHANNYHVAENIGVRRLFNEAGAYFDNATQKLQISEPPKNKIEKHHLKVLRRIHWRTMQSLKEKLSQYPPSYNLKFDRSKINFTRLKPYIYVLIHECMCVDGEMKAAKPSWFEYLVAETLLAYVDSKCISPQQAEEKLCQWGARPVRARQCVTHLWHVLAISSRSPQGCAEDVIQIEEDVIQGKRTSLDYAHACAFSLKQAKLQTGNSRRGKLSTSIKHGLEVKRARKTKVNVLRSAYMFSKREKIAEENAKSVGNHVTIEQTKHADNVNDRAQDANEHAQDANEHAKDANEYAQDANEYAQDANEHAQDANEHAQDANEYAQDANEHAKEEITHEKIQQKASTKGSDALKQVSRDRTGKKRKRSRQFKNVPLEERKRIKAQCLQLLSTL